jgi:hypothetical protein
MNITFRMPRGGHYWHAVPEGQAPALCGHVPAALKRQVPWEQGWLYHHRSMPPADGTCARCLERLQHPQRRRSRRTSTRIPF